MRLTLSDIRSKEVINLRDGACFGYADDLMIETENKTVLAVVIRGKAKLFGLLGREEDTLIPWEKIDSFGRDTVLVKTEINRPPQRPGFFTKFLNNF